MDARERTAWSQAASEQFRIERGLANISKSEVARRAGIPWSTYLKLDKGSSVPDISQIARICEGLGIDEVAFMAHVQARVKALMSDPG